MSLQTSGQYTMSPDHNALLKQTVITSSECDLESNQSDENGLMARHCL